MASDDDENGGSNIQFKHFNVVPLVEDHHYLQSNKPNLISINANIMKEWRILEKNLPESIYVEVYDTRIDLLRAVIIGAAGTPYHDGLFFFDIALPCDYPKTPPKVNYHSHGYRLNPNLYEDGKVCLSLLNTWSGSKVEMWSEKSSILQILVSIQGLVLNERPFFNEPICSGKSNDSKWINKSLDYSEGAFILSCKTMLHVMRKPPRNFEGFVAQHFCARAASILEAIEQYDEGSVLVGQFQMNAASSSGRNSSNFKDGLANVKWKLRKAFTGGSEYGEENHVEKHEKGIMDKLITRSCLILISVGLLFLFSCK